MASPESLAARFDDLRRLLLLGAVTVMFCLTGLAIGLNGTGQLMVVIAGLFLVIALLAARYPWFAVGMPLLIFADLGISLSADLSFAGAQLNLADLLILPAFIPTLLRIASGRRSIPYPNLSSVLLLILVGAGFVLGFYYGNDPAVIRNELHIFLYIFLGYFWAVTEIRTRDDLRRLLILLIVVTSLAGLKAMVMSIVGSMPVNQTLLQTADITSDQLGGTRTILLGADTLFVVIMPIMAAVALYCRKKSVYLWLLAAAVPICAGLLLSLTRSNWAAVVITVLLTLMLGTRTQGFRSLKIGLSIVLVFVIAIMLVSALYPNLDNFSFIDLIQRRFSFDPAEGSGTLDYRVMEGQALMRVAQKHLYLGNGLGAKYSYIEYRGILITNWSHDGFLYLVLKYGVVGLALFLLAMMLSMWKSTNLAWRARDSLLGAAGVGMPMALLSLLLMSLLMNKIGSMEGAYFIGLAVATPPILARIGKAGDEQPAIAGAKE